MVDNGQVYLLRQLSAADRAAFRSLRLAALEANPDDFVMTLEEERAVARLDIEGALESPGPRQCFFGAFAPDSGGLVAIGGLFSGGLRKTWHVGYIGSVFVDPGHRRRGLARMLMERLLSHASEAGFRAIRIEVVAENHAAIALYEQLGFVAYGREPDAY